MEDAQTILRTLEPLFADAERNGLWFHCNYQDLWFSPKELKEQHKKGSFIWGSVNWNLRHPRELIQQMEVSLDHAKKSLETVKNRVINAYPPPSGI